MKILGARMKELRIERGLQQAEVAEVFGLSQSAITSYETGAREPKCDMLIKFADFYNVSLDYMLGRTNKRNNEESKDLVELINNTAITFNDYELSETNKRRLLDISIGLFWHDKSSFDDKQ